MMGAWTVQLSLEPDSATPVFLQIARAVSDDVRRGRLRPGAPLPGSRGLAETLGVHRNTVLAAYQELEAEGWIETRPARGTFVSASLPELPARPALRSVSAAPRVGFDLPPMSLADPGYVPQPGVLSLGGGMPDLRHVPVDALARAYRRALRRTATHVLDYGDPRGHVRLRAAIAEMLSTRRGLAVDAESVLVTRGSQMGLFVVARALLQPGDAVAVEELGYRPAWEALRLAGARLVPVPVDDQGLDVEALERLTRREKLKAIYVTPHHQYPTTAVLAPGRRMALLRLAARQRIPVIEDDYDHEFHYEGRPVLPLASNDPAGVVVYVGTLSKILAPGLRIGFVTAPRELVTRFASLRRLIDRQGDHAVECAVAELLEEGEVQRHARRMRRVYLARRDALVSGLTRTFPDTLRLHAPAGGISLWAEVVGVDVDAWAERALAAGVSFYPGQRYTFDGRSHPFARLSFAALNERELAEAVRRMAAALPSTQMARNRTGRPGRFLA